MAKREQSTTDSAKVPNRGTAILMFATIADTTWRLFVPVFVLFGIGFYFDNEQQQKPIFGLIGAITGALLGFMLVRQQYRQIIRKEEEK
jgi:hypothetical protein